MTGRLPPAGRPLGGDAWGAALSGFLRPREEGERFAAALGERFGGAVIRLHPSGRAALRSVLLACRTLRPERPEVVLGAYTCWSVPAAIRRTGLVPRPVDLDPETLDFDAAALAGVDGEKVAAVVTHHLCGLPNDTARLEEAARSWGAFLVDDGAQAFGARFRGGAVGSAGAAGILSFGRGKGLPALGGGAVVIPGGSPLAGVIPDGAPPVRGGGGVILAVLHGLFFRPSLYGIPAVLPFLHVGETNYDENFAEGRPSGSEAALGARLLSSEPEDRAGRIRIAAEYREGLAGVPGIRIPTPIEGAEPSYIRFPLLLPAHAKERFIARAAPLGASPYYPAPVTAIPAAAPIETGGPWPGAESIAARLVTLPVHPRVGERERRRLMEMVREAVR
ncbi:MAG: DegT/DnrJ/EryC1/StrS family aminotransferase [Candidatus Eisenbacteria bacterium]